MTALLVLWALAGSLLASAARSPDFCPNGCTCDDDTLVGECIDANLDVIPITLNPSIQRLVLKHNRIKTVHAAFQFYGLLQYVDLSYNHLVSIPTKSFDAQRKLVELHLEHNKISAVSNQTFIGLQALTVLNLRQNFLEELPERAFASLPRLEQLDLGQNRIASVHPQAFAGLSQLRVLQLDDNQLRAVPTPALASLGCLAELHVGLNAFAALPDDAFRGLARLSVLDLGGAGLVNVSEHAFRGLDGQAAHAEAGGQPAARGADEAAGAAGAPGGAHRGPERLRLARATRLPGADEPALAGRVGRVAAGARAQGVAGGQPEPGDAGAELQQAAGGGGGRRAGGAAQPAPAGAPRQRLRHVPRVADGVARAAARGPGGEPAALPVRAALAQGAAGAAQRQPGALRRAAASQGAPAEVSVGRRAGLRAARRQATGPAGRPGRLGARAPRRAGPPAVPLPPPPARRPQGLQVEQARHLAQGARVPEDVRQRRRVHGARRAHHAAPRGGAGAQPAPGAAAPARAGEMRGGAAPLPRAVLAPPTDQRGPEAHPRDGAVARAARLQPARPRRLLPAEDGRRHREAKPAPAAPRALARLTAPPGRRRRHRPRPAPARRPQRLPPPARPAAPAAAPAAPLLAQPAWTPLAAQVARRPTGERTCDHVITLFFFRHEYVLGRVCWPRGL